jgi:hypothetical protein
MEIQDDFYWIKLFTLSAGVFLLSLGLGLLGKDF